MTGYSLEQITAWLDSELAISEVSDTAVNGLQVAGTRRINKVAVAVDASLQTFQAAVEASADLLIVHHGILWGKSERITGRHYSRLKCLLDSGIALYAAHLPLDMHPRLGNNAIIAKKLGLKSIKPFGTYHDTQIGFGGKFESRCTLQQFAAKIYKITTVIPRLYSFGKKNNRNIAIVSGGGASCIEEACLYKYDVFLTGEIGHADFFPAKENKLNLVVAGHYATETLGVKAISEWLKKKLGIETVFLDFPTDL